MTRMEPGLAVAATITLYGLLMAAPREGEAQTSRQYAAASRTVPARTGKGLAAMDEAARDGKYLFIFFWKADDEQTRNSYGVFQSAMKKWAESTNSIGIQITDPNEKPVVDKFGVSRAPMPLVLALAPNGAVTKGFPLQFTEAQLQEAFVSPCTARCMKALQNRKLVLLCVQNQQTQFSRAALQGARDFKADARFAQATEVVTIDPGDSTEASFLQALQVDPRTPIAVTVLLAPPGQPVARFAGAVTEDQIIAKVEAGPCPKCKTDHRAPCFRRSAPVRWPFPGNLASRRQRYRKVRSTRTGSVPAGNPAGRASAGCQSSSASAGRFYERPPGLPYSLLARDRPTA